MVKVLRDGEMIPTGFKKFKLVTVDIGNLDK